MQEGKTSGGYHESAVAKCGKKAAAARSRSSTAAAIVAPASPMTSVAAVSSAVSADAMSSTSGPRRFDPAGFSQRFLRLEDPQTVCCHTNCGQSSQGTAFLEPPIRAGERVTLQIRCRQKPGRMRYFVGAAPERFDVDAGQAAIQAASYSLENLKAAPNRPRAPCGGSAPPCFHAGSTVTMTVDLRSAAGTIGWHVESTGVAHSISLDDRAARELHAFVSLYNREAVFEIVSRDTSDK